MQTTIMRMLLMSVLALLALAINGEVLGQTNWSVNGFVVDENSKPISGATVSFIYPTTSCFQCFDANRYATTSRQDGFFSLADIISYRGKIRLLIEEAVPDDLWVPVSPSEHVLSGFPEFRGTTLHRFRSGKTIQMGNIMPHIRFRRITVNLADLFGGKMPLSPMSIVKISVEYKGKRLVREMSVAERSIDRPGNKINIALPIGKWALYFKVINGREEKTGRIVVQTD